MSLFRKPEASPAQASSVVSRRAAVAGMGAAGAAAAAATLLPASPTEVAAPVQAAAKATEFVAGYQESDHVLRYYRTARL